MTIWFQPTGRGNWRLGVMTVNAAHMPPFVVKAGDTFKLGDVEFRVIRISA